MMKTRTLIILLIVLSLFWIGDHRNQLREINSLKYCTDTLQSYCTASDLMLSSIITNDTIRLNLKRKYIPTHHDYRSKRNNLN